MNECIIGVGSNIEPEKNIARMLELMQEQTNLVKVSSWIRTAPLGITDQPGFINGALKINTSKSQPEFNAYLKSLENAMGRDRSVPKYGPRIIDLDIVVWNGKVVDNDYYHRDFLQKAVDEIW